MNDVRLGLGLLSIGRLWGVRGVPPPSEKDAIALLQSAYEKGIRFFDTAPAYAASERLLGAFLAQFTSHPKELTIATKMGEHWDLSSGSSRVSHAYADLTASIDASIRHLGSIDILQVHKATKDNLASKDVLKAIDYARSHGIEKFGASVSDLDAVNLACRVGHYQYLQLPFNINYTILQPAFQQATEHNVKILVNRPLAMGALIKSKNKKFYIAEAYQFILKQNFSGGILMGTSSQLHLAENIAAFNTSRS